MKQFFRFLLLSIFLASCANSATPAPSVTATVTLTPHPTPTKTEKPATPTEIPDPNAPKDGYDTREKKNGEWVYYKEINEVKAAWTKVETTPGNIFYEWTYSATTDPNGIWILDNREFQRDSPSEIRMMVNQLPSQDHSNMNLWIDHPNPAGNFETLQKRVDSLSGRFYNDFEKKAKSKYMSEEFFKGFYKKDGAILFFDITTPDGKTYHWYPTGKDINKDGKYIVTQVPFDEATGPEFMQVPYDEGSDVIYRLALTTDKDGNLHAFMAVSKDILELTDQQQSLFVLAGLWEAVLHADGSQMVNVKNSKHFEPTVENAAISAVPISDNEYHHFEFVVK